MHRHLSLKTRQSQERTALGSIVAPQRELAVIDGNLQGWQQLAQGVRPGVETAILDPSRDGIAQITEILSREAANGGHTTLHIVGHAEPGSLQLGTAQLSRATLSRYAADLQLWQKLLLGCGVSGVGCGETSSHVSEGCWEPTSPPHTPHPTPYTLLIYGCSFAAGETGQNFLRVLSELTGANIAASSSPVGSAAKGGNWELDTRIGDISAAVAFSPELQQAYAGVFAIYNVTSAPADGAAGSLRAAIIAANGNGTDDTINLAAGNYTLTLAGTGEDAAGTGDLDITSNIIIRGASAATTTINAASLDRVLHVIGGGTGVTVTLENVTITGGSLTGAADIGGGILNDNLGGTLTVNNSTIIGNTANLDGGGIDNAPGATLVVTNSTISGNAASTRDGGGIDNNALANLTVTNSTISGNTTGSGAAGLGGGIYDATGGTTTITNATITGNTANNNGGGIFNAGAAITVNNSIVTGNTATAATDEDLSGAFTGTNNLIGIAGSASGTAVTSAITATAAATINTTLGNNGGPTQTHALVPTGPAVDMGNNAAATAAGLTTASSDQRGTGFGRIFDDPGLGTTDTIDIGAYEVQPQINVRGGATPTDIPGGTPTPTNTPTTTDDTDFGNVEVNTPDANTFTIQNVSPDALVDLTPTGVTITGASEFTVTANPGTPVTPGADTTFGITFTPTTTGARTAIVSIANNDPDEAPYTFTITGNGVDTTPPTVTNLVPNLTPIGPGNVGAGTFTLTVDFSEAMNTGINPTLSFPTAGEDPTNTITFASGTWTDADTYVATYNVADVNEIINNIDVQVTGAQDVAGNTQTPSTQPDEFSIETASSIQFSAASFTDGEAAGTSNVVTLTRSGDTTGTSTVQVSITGGTATGGGTDYDSSSFPLTVTFAPGSTSQTVAIPIVDDNLFEPGGDETITFSVANNSDGIIGTQSTATLNITDNDSAPVVTLALTGSPLAEAGGVATVTANLSNPSTQDVTIDLGLTGTATGGGTDYTPSGTQIVIPAGSTTGSITITGVGDALTDPDETVIVDVTAVTNGTESGTQQVTATITEAPLPEIQVLDGTIDIVDGTTTANDFGSAVVGGTLSKTFTINNTGTADLNLSGLTLPTGFSGTLPTSVAAGGNATFTVNVDTATVGTLSGTLQFVTDDADENPFDFPISAEITATAEPEIRVVEGTTDIVDGATTPLDFGSAAPGGTLSRTFTIENIGSGPLDLSNLTLPAGFTGTLPTGPIAPGGSATLTINVDTAAAGTPSGEISFVTNDSDENPFNFPISATVAATAAPEIQVLDGTTDIPDGTTTANDFGSTTAGGVLSKTFTINNTGSGPLNLSNLTLPDGFTLNGAFPDTIAAGGSGTFIVSAPSTPGNFSGEISFTTNDGDENPFNFPISAQVNAPDIQVLDGTNAIADGTTTTVGFGSVDAGGTLSRTFTINNTGNAPLDLSNPTLPAGFSLAGDLPATVAAGGTATFTINVDTTNAGTFVGVLQLVNSDSDENPFDFPISATVNVGPVALADPDAGVPPVTDGPGNPTDDPTPGDPTPGGDDCPPLPGLPSSLPELPSLPGLPLVSFDAVPLNPALAGDDTIIGGGGNDFLAGSSGNDWIEGLGGSDIIIGGNGSLDPAGSGSDNDVLFGNPGDDLLQGSEGSDTIYGGKDNDFAHGGKNGDLMYGDVGNDTLSGDEGDDQIFGGPADPATGDPNGQDLIFGGAGNDFLNGNQGNDSLSGGTGNDVVRGGIDNDLINGDSGDDLVYGDQGSDTISGGDGNDTIFGGVSDSDIGDAGGQDLISGGAGNDFLNGNEGDDSLSGGLGNDLIRGGIDNDLVYGDSGDDFVYGDQGSDTISGGDGNDTIFGGVSDSDIGDAGGQDLIFGGAGNDFINGNESNDSLSGGLGNDTVRGGTGDDIVKGDSGDDLIFGDNGADRVCGEDGNDTIFGGIGSDAGIGSAGQQDTLCGGAGNDFLNGNEGEDQLDGGTGNDTLRGGKDSDTILGGEGSDVLWGDLGNDFLTGGAGGDTFVLAVGDGTDVVTDFTDGIDFIGLSGVAFVELSLTTANGATSINLGSEVLATLSGVNISALTEADFVTV